MRTGTPFLELPSAAVFFPALFSPELFSPELFSPELFSPELFSPELFSPEHGRKKYQQCENFEAPEGHREAEQDLGGIGYIGVM